MKAPKPNALPPTCCQAEPASAFFLSLPAVAGMLQPASPPPVAGRPRQHQAEELSLRRGAGGRGVAVQTMVLDVLDHRIWDQILHAAPLLQLMPHLGR